MSRRTLICVANDYSALEAIGKRLAEAGYEVVCTTRPAEASALLFLKDAGAAVLVRSPEDPATSEVVRALRLVRPDISVFAIHASCIYRLASRAGDPASETPPGLAPTLDAIAASPVSL